MNILNITTALKSSKPCEDATVRELAQWLRDVRAVGIALNLYGSEFECFTRQCGVTS